RRTSPAGGARGPGRAAPRRPAQPARLRRRRGPPPDPRRDERPATAGRGRGAGPRTFRPGRDPARGGVRRWRRGPGGTGPGAPGRAAGVGMTPEVLAAVALAAAVLLAAPLAPSGRRWPRWLPFLLGALLLAPAL